jgi:hypothetical protein
MDSKKIFKSFLNDLKEDCEGLVFSDSVVADFEEMITPKIMKVLQRDRTIFEESFEVFGKDVSTILRSKPELDKYWKHIQSCSFASFLSGDIKGKIGKLLESFSGAFEGQTEIDKVLGSEESRSKVSEIMEFVMTTKLAKVVTSLVESIDISSLGIDFDNLEDAMKSIQEPSNKIMENIMKKVKEELDMRLRRGDFTKEQLMRDIENIKVKIQEAFGDMFNDMLGGRKADVPTAAILGNTPEARRARMMARLRRKVAEKNNGE